VIDPFTFSVAGYVIVFAELAIVSAFLESRWWARARPLTRNIMIGLCFVFPPVYLFIASVLLAEWF
jgi:hypothetical protein